MNKRLRYFVLFLCVVIFFVIAPLLILFVRGVKYNADNERLDHTGIIAAETTPGDATIFIDDKKVGATPASVRFLPPQDYTVKLHKDGYFDWEKRLTVLDGKVTWVNSNPNKLVLLKADPEPHSVVASADDFELLSSGSLAYVTNTAVVILSGKDFATTQTVSMPERILSLVPNPDGAYILAQGQKNNYIIKTSTTTFSTATSKVPTGSLVSFLDSTTLIVLNDGILSRVDITSLASTQLSASISSFTIVGKELYAIQRGEESSALLYQTFNSETPLSPLLTALPVFNNDQIYISTDKRIFLWGDGTLYRVNERLETLATNVTAASFDRAANTLLFTTPGELSYYNFDENKVKLISRSGQAFQNITLRKDLNYAFFFQGNKLLAIELDDRDRQNTYTIYEAIDPKKIEFSADGNIITILDGKGISVIDIK